MPRSTCQLPQAIFFDLDGTLLDSLPGIASSIEQAFVSCGLPVRAIDLRQLIGPPIRTILSLAANSNSEEELDLLERAFRVNYDSDGWKKTQLFPGASELLKEAYSLHIQLFVISNKPRHISLQILERAELVSLFKGIVTRDSCEPPHVDKTEMIRHVLHEFRLEAERCIMVGDTTEDANAAAATRVPFAWASHGYGKLPSSCAVAFRIQSFDQFLPMFVQEFAQ